MPIKLIVVVSLCDILNYFQREIEERKWTGVPPWKIPLLAKQEKERLVMPPQKH